MNDTRGANARGANARGANDMNEHTAVERVAKKLLDIENNEKRDYAESRKKYNKIWRKLMDE